MTQFWLMTGIVLFHNIIELYLLSRKKKNLFWLKPVVLGAVVIFLLQHGALTNFFYTNADGSFYINYGSLLEREPQWLSYTMSIVLASSVVYWIGYKLHGGIVVGSLYLSVYRKFWDFPVSHYRLLIGLLIAWGIKLILNHYGGLGHRLGLLTEEIGYLHPVAARLKVFEDLSLVFTMIFMFLTYRYKTNLFYKIIFLASLSGEIILAFTTGNRSGLVFVFIAVFLVNYYFSNRLRLIWVISGIAVIYVAMTTLERFKTFSFLAASDVIHITNPVEYIRLANEFSKDVDKVMSDKSKQEMFRLAVGRFNYINELAQVIQYKSINGLREEDPDFLSPMFTFPLFAVLPQYYIFGKQPENIGAWATELVVGHRRYSTAISPMGYAFAAGSTLFVLFIFFILGILMKAAEFLLFNIKTIIGFILFVAILDQLVMFDSVIYGTFINLIRYGLLLPPILWLSLKKY